MTPIRLPEGIQRNNKPNVLFSRKKLTILENFTLADIKSFPKKCLRGYIEGFAHGNITKRDALKLSTKVEIHLDSNLKVNQVFKQKRLVLDNGKILEGL